jgi:hypothetical protein
MTIQIRATLLFSLLTLLMILMFGIFTYIFANHYAFEDFYKRLETRVNLAAAIHLNDSTNGDPDQIKNLRQAYLEKLTGEKEYLLQIPADYSLEDLKKKMPTCLILS